MGDIDDFFAKKDKKKKGTKKFSKANTDVIAKNLIDSDRKELKELERQEKEVGTQLIEEKPILVLGTPAIPPPQEDEEWDDYRENKKDYSGLKIENLKIEEQISEDEEEETEINEDGEVVKVRKDDSGPWSKLAGQPGTYEPHHQQDLTPEPEPSIQTPNVVGGSYIPPHMRGGAPAAAEPERKPVPRGRMRPAPDINSEVYFPSLSSASEDGGPKGAWGKTPRGTGDGGHFEEVRERGNQNISRHTEAPKLSLENKFSALRDGD
ncbi:protein CDV3 homolog [Eurytemora carolleeae]|uniref:protein CDV3 homolog n=1 Tax=Eurytemora carolleeae TaxID=1294199 RepID=UPI000C78E1B7|nr:protein CDV3 homolog [Eurytemora carolleeae]|eukprot:XP_023323991.1 protein CDV3 homolog [Eurytemora affinis]